MSRRLLPLTTVLTPTQEGEQRARNHRARLRASTCTHWFTWRHLRCKLDETCNFLSLGWTLLQLRVIAARDTPCPITTTGFLAHQIDAEALAAAGGAVAFMSAWMDREAESKAYTAAMLRWRQGDLFDHAGLEESPAR
ncbi:MAG: hypothetical protein AB7U66_18285 [Hyphomicrobiaceae bacterium]|uniref:hypothetical protein n=2 Tax=Bradyrhizobium sp. TaxID=376 RepID=UPI003D0CB3E9